VNHFYGRLRPRSRRGVPESFLRSSRFPWRSWRRGKRTRPTVSNRADVRHQTTCPTATYYLPPLSRTPSLYLCFQPPFLLSSILNKPLVVHPSCGGREGFLSANIDQTVKTLTGAVAVAAAATCRNADVCAPHRCEAVCS